MSVCSFEDGIKAIEKTAMVLFQAFFLPTLPDFRICMQDVQNRFVGSIDQDNCSSASLFMRLFQHVGKAAANEV